MSHAHHRRAPVYPLAGSLCILFALGLFTASPAFARGEIVRDYSIDSEGIETIEIRAGVGDMRLRRSDGDTVSVRLAIEGSRRGVLRRRVDVSDMELEIDRQNGRLTLRFEPSGAKADWVVELPDLPDVQIRLGVGEIRGELPGSDSKVQVGVGNVELDVPKDAVRNAHATSGVGSAEIIGGDTTEASRNLVTESSRSEGPGEHDVRVEVGVGEIVLRLR